MITIIYLSLPVSEFTERAASKSITNCSCLSKTNRITTPRVTVRRVTLFRNSFFFTILSRVIMQFSIVVVRRFERQEKALLYFVLYYTFGETTSPHQKSLGQTAKKPN